MLYRYTALTVALIRMDLCEICHKHDINLFSSRTGHWLCLFSHGRAIVFKEEYTSVHRSTDDLQILSRLRWAFNWLKPLDTTSSKDSDQVMLFSLPREDALEEQSAQSLCNLIFNVVIDKVYSPTGVALLFPTYQKIDCWRSALRSNTISSVWYGSGRLRMSG